MRSVVLASIALSLAASGCHRRRSRRPRARAPVARWLVAPPLEPAQRVHGGFTLHGAVRAENGRAAPLPAPLGAIVATARMADGTWRFAAQDGSLYRARDFTAALQRVGELPFALEAPAARERVVLQGSHGEGALIVRSEDLDAYRVDADGAHRRLPLHGVISALSVDARTLLALCEPGTLARSVDGGASFETLRPPAGVAVALWMSEDGPRVRTTAGTLRYRDGALIDDGTALTPERSLAVPSEVIERVRGSVLRAPWSLAPGESASPDGRVVYALSGAQFVTLRARDGAELGREAAPGERCALAEARRGVGAVCVRGWAKVVLARGPGERGWRVLRDERDAAPVGEVFFDPRSGVWATTAPCAQGRDAQGALCVIDEDGVARELRGQGTLLGVMDHRLIFVRDGQLRALDPQGAELAVAPSRLDAQRGAVVRRARGAAVVIPRGAHGGRAWVLQGEAWSERALPGRFADLSDEGEWIAWSQDAGSLQRSRDGARFEPLSPPVDGDPRTLSLSDEPLRCVAGWCQLGASLTRAAGLPYDASALARRAPLAAVATRGAQRALRCVHGATTPAADLDHGAAATGYAVRLSTPAPDRVELRWEGDLVRGRASHAVPRREGARVEVRGVAFATRPVALVTRCDTRGCDHLLVTPERATDLALGRAQPSGVEVHAWSDGYTVRVDEVRREGSLVSLVQLGADGALGRRRTYALAGRLEDAAAGRWRGRDGLWIAPMLGPMRFYPIDGVGDGAQTAPAPDARTRPCATSAVGEGEARWVHAVPVVRGEGWFLERGRWHHEQRLSLSEGETCSLAIGAGEPHEESEAARESEEREALRSFVLRAEGGEVRGEGWSGRRRISLRCNEIE